MMGFEKMISSMVGLTPEEMKAKAAEFEGFVKAIAEGLVSIAEQNKLILDRLAKLEEGLENERQKRIGNG